MKKTIEIVARMGVFATFLGHGFFAYGVNPKWIPLLTCYGFTSEQAIDIMPFIGVFDIIVAIIILFYPIKIIVIWAVFWAFMASLSRVISGDSIFEFVERFSNWCLPLVLLIVNGGLPKKISYLFKRYN